MSLEEQINKFIHDWDMAMDDKLAKHTAYLLTTQQIEKDLLELIDDKLMKDGSPINHTAHHIRQELRQIIKEYCKG